MPSTDRSARPAPRWRVILTTVVITTGLAAAGAMLGSRVAAATTVAWPGILLLSHAGWAMRTGAVRARINRKEVIGDPDEYRWVVTVRNADVVTRRDSPTYFRLYVGAELVLGVFVVASTLLPALMQVTASSAG
jgi:hypothetical protein